jgi:hypothetical protein
LALGFTYCFSKITRVAHSLCLLSDSELVSCTESPAGCDQSRRTIALSKFLKRTIASTQA